jgi:hypothetical protein
MPSSRGGAGVGAKTVAAADPGRFRSRISVVEEDTHAEQIASVARYARTVPLSELRGGENAIMSVLPG